MTIMSQLLNQNRRTRYSVYLGYISHFISSTLMILPVLSPTATKLLIPNSINATIDPDELEKKRQDIYNLPLISIPSAV